MKSRGIAGLLAGLMMLAVPALAQPVTVFAAASTTNALTDIAEAFTASGGGKVTLSFAASSTLAKQVEQGAPVHVFLSADEKWMNYMADKGLIDPATRVNLLGNRLALIAPADGAVAPVDIAPGFPLAQLLGDGRLVTGDPDHVPVGLYARQALEKLGVWSAVQDRLARVDSVRAAVALVERGEVPLGIVYTTDAAISSKVKVVGIFPADSHPPVVYPAALVAGPLPASARAFLEFMGSPAADVIWRKYGFTVTRQPS